MAVLSSGWNRVAELVSNQSSMHGYFDAIGLIVLAEIDVAARRTACTGSSSFWDALVIVPGLHRQQQATELSKSEYPACAAMTTGYVFRVENQAMVLYMQKCGKTGHLTTLEVSPSRSHRHKAETLATLAYGCAVVTTIIAIYIYAVVLQDPWALGVLATFVFIRACNIAIIKHRSRAGWFGAPEPGEQSDLLVLLSQDRWIRLQGPTDDVKAVTSGSWMREPTFLESWVSSTATLLTYLNVALSINMQQSSKVVLLGLFLVSYLALGFATQLSSTMQMHGRHISVKYGPKAYARRRDLADELVEETRKKHWAMKLGLLPSEPDDVEPPVM